MSCTFTSNKIQTMPKYKCNAFVAQINQLPNKKIYLNINHLEKGDYELNIIHQKKVIVKTSFIKK